MTNRRRGGAVAWLIIGTFFLAFMGPGAFQSYLRNALPEDWPPVKITGILAVLYFSFMIWRLLIPASQRFFGDKWSLVLASLSYVLLPATLLVTTDYRVLLALAALWGWGAAGLWQTGPVWLYDATDEHRRGFWAGVLYAAVFMGLLAGIALQGRAVATSGRTVLLTLAAAAGALSVMLALALPPRSGRSEKLSLSSMAEVVLDRRVMLLGILLFASATSYGLLLGAFRDSIQETFGKEALGWVLSFYFAARLVVSISGGYLSDIFARRTVMALTFAAGGAALAAAAKSDEAWAFAAAAGCLGLVSGLVPVSTTAFSADWFAPERRSLALGGAFIWRDAGVVVSLLGGQYLVTLSGGFKMPLAVFAAVFLLCGVVSLVLPAADRSTVKR